MGAHMDGAHMDIGKHCVIDKGRGSYFDVLLLGTLLCLCASAQSQQPTRTWEFDLKTPGTYKVQVQHDLNGFQEIAVGVTKVTYSISIGKETRSRELNLI